MELEMQLLLTAVSCLLCLGIGFIYVKLIKSLLDRFIG